VSFRKKKGMATIMGRCQPDAMTQRKIMYKQNMLRYLSYNKDSKKNLTLLDITPSDIQRGVESICEQGLEHLFNEGFPLSEKDYLFDRVALVTYQSKEDFYCCMELLTNDSELKQSSFLTDPMENLTTEEQWKLNKIPLRTQYKWYMKGTTIKLSGIIPCSKHMIPCPSCSVPRWDTYHIRLDCKWCLKLNDGLKEGLESNSCCYLEPDTFIQCKVSGCQHIAIRRNDEFGGLCLNHIAEKKRIRKPIIDPENCKKSKRARMTQRQKSLRKIFEVIMIDKEYDEESFSDMDFLMSKIRCKDPLGELIEHEEKEYYSLHSSSSSSSNSSNDDYSDTTAEGYHTEDTEDDFSSDEMDIMITPSTPPIILDE